MSISLLSAGSTEQWSNVNIRFVNRAVAFCIANYGPSSKECNTSISKFHLHEIHFQYPHEFGHKSFKVENDLGSRLDTVLVES